MGPRATTRMIRRSRVPCGRSKLSSVFFIPMASTYTRPRCRRSRCVWCVAEKRARCLVVFCEMWVVHAAKAVVGLRPSFSSHVRFGERGEPVQGGRLWEPWNLRSPKEEGNGFMGKALSISAGRRGRARLLLFTSAQKTKAAIARGLLV